MDYNRRAVGVSVAGALAGSLLSACSTETAMPPNRASQRPALLLIHGSWLGAWCYSGLIAQLNAKGVAAFAPDFPGHALRARFPASFLKRPLDAAAFSSEPSPLAAVSLSDYVKEIHTSIDWLTVQGYGPITLLGHSMAGIPITAASEMMPTRVSRLIYLSAFMPVTAAPAANYLGMPANSKSQVASMLLADPTKIGALRLDTSSADPTYVARLKTMFCADAPDADFPAIAHMMQPDDPIQAFATPTGATRERWGSIPRIYIGCTQDNVVPPALQQQFCREADSLVPSNKVEFHTFNSSHTPFFSKPADLAVLLTKLMA